jgi:HEAT repeat protein
VRAAGRHPSPEIDAALVGMLAGGDDQVAEAAALALGDPAHADAAEALAIALDRPEPRVRMAAIRALGRIGTPEAREALETVAETHKDPATRHRATAEIRTLARQTRDRSAVSGKTDQ